MLENHEVQVCRHGESSWMFIGGVNCSSLWRGSLVPSTSDLRAVPWHTQSLLLPADMLVYIGKVVALPGHWWCATGPLAWD